MLVKITRETYAQGKRYNLNEKVSLPDELANQLIHLKRAVKANPEEINTPVEDMPKTAVLAETEDTTVEEVETEAESETEAEGISTGEDGEYSELLEENINEIPEAEGGAEDETEEAEEKTASNEGEKPEVAAETKKPEVKKPASGTAKKGKK